MISNFLKISIIWICHYSILTLFLYFGIPAIGQNVDGKLLHGGKWQKFQTSTMKADFYVSPKGNDQWSGTLPEPNKDFNDGPFVSIDKAQKAVRELKSKIYFTKDAPIEKRWIGSPHPFGKGKDILVFIREGTYYINKPLLFEPEDGGERVETNLPTGAFEYHQLKDHFVTYAAYPGENPVISGGIPVQNWQKKGNFWTASIQIDTVSLFLVNGKKQQLARTPNKGYFVPPAISKNDKELYFKKNELKDWKEIENNRIVLLLRWHTGINRISGIDTKQGIAYLRSPQEGVLIVPPRYYIENIKALLDTAGEWYFDQKKKEISYLPSPDQPDPNASKTEISKLNKFIQVQGIKGHPVKNLRFYGLTFQGAISGSNAVSFRYSNSCEFVDGAIRSCQGTGIQVSAGCYQTRILSNQIESVDNGGIYVIGSIKPIWRWEADYQKGASAGQDGDSPEIIRETLISYNKLSDCGGINIYASNTLMTTISHNYITKTRGRYGIDVGGWSNQEEAIDGGYLVEYNHLDDVQRDADDSGAIKTAGMTFNSIIRKNLVHDVRAGFFNDNVGFWFDNMSYGWSAEENIYYNLEQGEMKYCAALPEDNSYFNNFKIEAPVNKPEIILEADPQFQFSKQTIITKPDAVSGIYPSGSLISISANVYNSGSSGILPVEFYLNGKLYKKRFFPVIHNNTRTISFEIRIYDAGEHLLSIGDLPHQKIWVKGAKPTVVYEDIQLSEEKILYGETVKVKAKATNLLTSLQEIKAILYIENQEIKSTPLNLSAGEEKEISFEIQPKIGIHTIRIGNSSVKSLTVIEAVDLEVSKMNLLQHCSAKAKPFEITVSSDQRTFKIAAAGSDFYHAEDSYAAVYVKKITGDFVATVKINQFGERTHEWFRSGLFVRNDISQSFDVQPGSKGSVLLFGTPGRAGIQYDEFANGCMHKATSQNLPEHSKTPIFLKLVRHGNHFAGFISLDGQNWIIERRSVDIPGIAESVDIGLAAGGPDRRQYWVEFSDWKIQVAK